jgi:hypothetical protein
MKLNDTTHLTGRSAARIGFWARPEDEWPATDAVL